LRLVVRTPLSAEPERRYAVGLVLSEWLGLEYDLVREERDDLSITVTDSPGELRIADVFLSTALDHWLRPESMPVGPLPVWIVDGALGGTTLVDAGLPVLFGRELARGTYFLAEAGRATLGLDVFGSAFFMVTRYEEAMPGPRDLHERFPADAALAVREGFADRPIVNEYVEVLWSALSMLWPGLERAPRAPRVLPSHDIDLAFCRELSTSDLLLKLGSDVVRRRDLNLATRRLGAYRRGPGEGSKHDLCDTYDELIALSEQAGTTSAFYFFGERTGLEIDARYAPSDSPVRAVLRRIGERGHEIGLHASYGAHREARVIKRQLEALRTVCEKEGVDRDAWGSRQHYLRWETPTTWQALEDAGIAYDTTLGFSSLGGFRAGCCYEYPAFNVLTRQELKIRERPLVVMEVAVLDRQQLSRDQSLDEVLSLRKRCELFGGDFTILWHNSRLLLRADRALYAEILRSR